jgi:phosphoglycolate phosphatase-like HAD superfamily hydrolase
VDHTPYHGHVLELPDHVRACLFDLDGVLTQTATVHAAAWQELFELLDRT